MILGVVNYLAISKLITNLYLIAHENSVLLSGFS
jgi:hypothetical protein